MPVTMVFLRHAVNPFQSRSQVVCILQTAWQGFEEFKCMRQSAKLASNRPDFQLTLLPAHGIWAVVMPQCPGLLGQEAGSGILAVQVVLALGVVSAGLGAAPSHRGDAVVEVQLEGDVSPGTITVEPELGPFVIYLAWGRRSMNCAWILLAE